jgi:4-carboxymuconolactone decarboxylase
MATTIDPTTHAVRVPPLPRDQWTDASRAVFAYWGEPDAWEKGSAANLSMVLATHPPLAMAYYTFGRHLMVDSTLPLRPRELVTLRVSWHTRSYYEWHYHVGYALNLGMSLDEIRAVGEGPNAATWNDEDRAVLRAVDDLHAASRISDATWAALGRHYDTPVLMDLLFTVGNYAMLSGVIASLGVQLEDGVDPISFDLVTASGAVPAKRYKPGEVEDWAAKNGDG